MKNTLKVSQKFFLFNAYSNYDPDKLFISGSDRVGIELLNLSKSKNFVIGPKILKNLIKSNNFEFINSDLLETKVLLIDYFLRTFFTVYILFRKNLNSSEIVSTSDFFCDTIPAFLFSKKSKWYAFLFHIYPRKISVRNVFGGLIQNFSFLLFKNSFKVLTTNRECENFLIKNFRIKQVQKINLGISIPKPKSVDLERIYDLAFVGRIKDSKGVFFLPDIVLKLKTKFPNINVLVIGNGTSSDISKLNSQIVNYKLSSNLKLLSNVTDQKLSDYLSQTKYLIQLSSEEGFGLVIPEALFCGAGVVGFDLNVYRDNFYDLELNMVSQGNTQELIETCSRLLVSYKGPVKIENSISRFDWKNIYQSIFG